MKPKFDINEFEQLKNKEIIFECEICSKDFNSTKKYLRRALGITNHINKPTLKYCSRECMGKGKMTGCDVECKECGNMVYRYLNVINKNKDDIFFCNNSCKGIYWNKNKMYGFNRSKMEVWIEEEITNKYTFDILFNKRNIIDNGYELDIFIPSLNLAFELNGIFHYKPVFGKDKLKIIEYRDIEKFNMCREINIELITIDISDSKHFNKKKDIKYLEFIINEIEKRIGR